MMFCCAVTAVVTGALKRNHADRLADAATESPVWLPANLVPELVTDAVESAWFAYVKLTAVGAEELNCMSRAYSSALAGAAWTAIQVEGFVSDIENVSVTFPSFVMVEPEPETVWLPATTVPNAIAPDVDTLRFWMVTVTEIVAGLLAWATDAAPRISVSMS